MRTIHIILPVNNPKMLNQEDLEPYQSADCFYQLTYTKTDLIELNTAEDVAEVTPLVVKEIQAAEKNGSRIVIVYAFGDVGIKESKDLVAIPVMGLGRTAIRQAYSQCVNKYTVIPAQLSHNTFIEALVNEESCREKFIPSSHALNLNPSEIKNNPHILERLIEAVIPQIEKGIVTFTLGCGSIIGLAKPLEQKLMKLYPNKSITVVDPVAVAFETAAHA